MRTSLNLLSPMAEIINVIGDPVRAAGWYGPTTGLHSIALGVTNFRGRISIQASLALAPEDADWFSVLPMGAAFWQYPRPGYFIQLPSTGETSNIGFNFITNALWVRAVVDRSYLPFAFAASSFPYVGLVNTILLNY